MEIKIKDFYDFSFSHFRRSFFVKSLLFSSSRFTSSKHIGTAEKLYIYFVIVCAQILKNLHHIRNRIINILKPVVFLTASARHNCMAHRRYLKSAAMDDHRNARPENGGDYRRFFCNTKVAGP